MWSSNPVISIKLLQQLVGELSHVPRTTWPACVKISFIVLCFLAAGRIFLQSSFQTSLDTSCLFIFTVWRWDVFWFSLDMTNDGRIPLRMTFDNLDDNISRCHSFIWHPASALVTSLASGDQPRLVSRLVWPLASHSAWILSNNYCPDLVFIWKSSNSVGYMLSNTAVMKIRFEANINEYQILFLDLIVACGLLLLHRLLLDPLDVHELPELRPLHPRDVEPLELLASLVIKHGLRRLSCVKENICAIERISLFSLLDFHGTLAF